VPVLQVRACGCLPAGSFNVFVDVTPAYDCAVYSADDDSAPKGLGKKKQASMERKRMRKLVHEVCMPCRARVVQCPMTTV
jgi:hypothetical protein